MVEQKFDVFLCHNSEDKPAVIEVAEKLRRIGLNPWLDVWELQPGAIWQYALERQIESIGAVAVFVGEKGVGPWQSEEIYAFLQEFVDRACPIIPVMLPGTGIQPPLPILLKSRHWVDFRIEKPDPLSQLRWGITGNKTSKELLADRSVKAQEANHLLQSESAETVLDKCYLVLEAYLKNQRWHEADGETYRLMIAAAGKTVGDWFEAEDLQKFPAETLQIIDTLWMKYSHGRYGFSVQKSMYLELDGTIDDMGAINDGEALDRFFHANGWKTNGKLSFSINTDHNTDAFSINLNPPKGHFPKLGCVKVLSFIGIDANNRGCAIATLKSVDLTISVPMETGKVSRLTILENNVIPSSFREDTISSFSELVDSAVLEDFFKQRNHSRMVREKNDRVMGFDRFWDGFWVALIGSLYVSR